jgi:formylglycine-generating enzyme required for sulfatase activity
VGLEIGPRLASGVTIAWSEAIMKLERDGQPIRGRVVGLLVAVVAAAGLMVYAVVRALTTPRTSAPQLTSAQAPRPASPPPSPPPSAEPPAPPEGMVLVPGGKFWMGSDDPEVKDAPWHEVTVSPFFMDKNEVTNEEFDRFVRATGYKTTAERPLDPKMLPPDAPPDALEPASLVFAPAPPSDAESDQDMIWWRLVPGASFRHPAGPGTSIAGRERHPVVQVSWEDAAAYAKWAGKRLPTEAEWELAARGGLEKKPFVWGDEARPGGKWLANVWQGKFPIENSGEDGNKGAAPVGSYPPNGYGLFDMAGNVAEWTADWYRADFYPKSPPVDPKGPADSLDPEAPGIPLRVLRGGSFLCPAEQCRLYQPGARDRAPPNTARIDTGFRCVRSAS